MRARVRMAGLAGAALLAALAGCGRGDGTLRIESEREGTYEIFDPSGNRLVATAESGKDLALPPGRYALFVNGAGALFHLRAGRQFEIRLADFTVEGAGHDRYDVLDPTGQHTLFSLPTGEGADLLTGRYQARLNGVSTPFSVAEGEAETLRAGTLLSPADGPPIVTVFDTDGQRLLFRGAGKPIELLPGNYVAEYAGRKRTVTIREGEATTLAP